MRTVFVSEVSVGSSGMAWIISVFPGKTVLYVPTRYHSPALSSKYSYLPDTMYSVNESLTVTILIASFASNNQYIYYSRVACVQKFYTVVSNPELFFSGYFISGGARIYAAGSSKIDGGANV